MAEDVDQVQPAPPADPCLEQLQRERADFLNYKRRVDRDRIEDRERARQELLRGLLPGIDDLDRALAHLPPDLRGHPWAEGVLLSRERFLQTLTQLGVERVGHEGEPFDPAVHEAVVYQEEPSAHEQHVLSVMRPGYRLGAQLLRPAQVVVSGPPRNGRSKAHQGRQFDHGQSHRN